MLILSVAKPTPFGVKMEANKKWVPLIFVIVSLFSPIVLGNVNPQDLASNFPGIYHFRRNLLSQTKFAFESLFSVIEFNMMQDLEMNQEALERFLEQSRHQNRSRDD